MRPGPRAKPTQIRILEGNKAHRPLPKNEPKPTPGRPICPAWISIEAKRKWRALVPELEKLGLLTKIDADLLAQYCMQYAMWRKCETFRAEKGDTYRTVDGEWKLRPEVNVSFKAAYQMIRLGSAFGLSPADRTKLSVQPKPEQDELDALLA